jgi:hypothetical protein
MRATEILAAGIADMTMTAAAAIIHKQGLVLDTEALAVELRAESVNALDRFLKDGKVLLDGGMSGWLNTALKVECVRAAQDAIATVQNEEGMRGTTRAQALSMLYDIAHECRKRLDKEV